MRGMTLRNMDQLDILNSIKDMVSTKKKGSSAVEKEGLDYIAKRLKIKN